MAPNVIPDAYGLIDTYAPEDTFEHRPEKVLLVATLELVVDDGRAAHLLIISPRYEPVQARDVDEYAQWTPPYVAKVIQGEREWRSFGAVKEAIEAEKASWGHAELKHLVRGWACGLTAVERVDDGRQDFTEFKRSWSSPTARNVYHVMRFRAAARDCDRTSLADPDLRKGFFYLPIDDARYAAVVRERHCDVHDRVHIDYLGQPLATNLHQVVRDEERRRQLRHQPVTLGEEHFNRPFEGLLLFGDIAGYGAASRYIQQYMPPVDRDTADRAEVLRGSATAGFTQLFQDAGIRQIHTAGDGFIVGIPMTDPAELSSRLARFLDAYGEYLTTIDTLKHRIAEHHAENKAGEEPRLGSRLALHWGSWRFGKMARAASMVAAFDGAPITEVARYEQGLSGIVKGDEDHPVKQFAHAFIASEALAEKVEDIGNLHPKLKHLDKTPAKSKEFEAPGHIFGWTG